MLVLVLISIVVSFVGIIIHTVHFIINFIVIHNDCIIISNIIPLRCSLCAAPPRPRCSPSCTASSSRTILASRCHISLRHLFNVLNSNRQDNTYKVSRLQGISFQFFKYSLCTAFSVFHSPTQIVFQIFRALANNLELLNFALNFYIYCLCRLEQLFHQILIFNFSTILWLSNTDT